MLVSLYTVRVVLNVLGAEDYGIYNVVAGVTVLFSFINSTLATSIQRFLCVEIGKNDNEKVRDIFSQSLVIVTVLAILIVILTEIGGLLFIKYKMNLPEGRRNAAIWVLHFASLITLFNTLKIPYNAIIISYEKMNFFALISVVEAILKLVVCFLLYVFKFDKLVFYSFLLFCVSIVIFLGYAFYSLISFPESHFKKVYDKDTLKKLLSFSGWSLFGGFASMANNQGMNLIINVFCGVVINAALGIAYQIYNAVYSFVTNFQTAFNPALVKIYSAGEKEKLFVLINRSAKFSYYLLLFIVVPLFVNLEFVLKVWLGEYSEMIPIFTKLLLIEALCSPINGPFWMTVQASGKIGKFQLIVSFIILLNLPFSYLFLKLGYDVKAILIIKIIVQVLVTIFRIIYLRVTEKFSIRTFFKECLIPIIIITTISFMFVYLIKNNIEAELLSFFISCVCSVFIVFLLVYFFGINREEKKNVKSFISNKIKRQNNN